MVQAEQLCHSSDITAPNAGVLASESRVIPFRRPARLRKIDWEYEPAAELIDTLERAPRSYGAPSLRMLVDTSFAQHRETGRPVDINIAGIPNIGKSTLVSQILARWNYMQRSASFPNDPSEIMAYISWDDILRTAGKELGIILPGQQDGDYTEKQLEQLTLVEEQADVLAKKKGFSVIKENPFTGFVLHNIQIGKDRGATLATDLIHRRRSYDDPTLVYDTTFIWLTAGSDVRERGNMMRRAISAAPGRKAQLLQSEGMVYMGRNGTRTTTGASPRGVEAVANEKYEAIKQLPDLPPVPRALYPDKDYHALCTEQAVAPKILGTDHLGLPTQNTIVARNTKLEGITRYQVLLDRHNFIKQLQKEGRIHELAV